MTFIAAAPRGQDAPIITQRAVASGASFEKGALLLVDANSDYAECGADPAAIYGTACTPYKTDTTGFNLLGRLGFPPGFMQAVKALDQLFHAGYEGTLPAEDGADYGVIRSADTFWRVDFTDTTADRVKLSGRYIDDPSDTTPNRVFVRFLATVCQDI